MTSFATSNGGPWAPSSGFGTTFQLLFARVTNDIDSFVVLKIIIGINLVHYAARRQADMDEREREDKINDFGRDPIGEGPEERVRHSSLFLLSHLTQYSQLYNKELKVILDDSRDDAVPVAEMGETVAKAKNGKPSGDGGDKKKRVPLEDITRFTMVKRIW
jgi:hypothetical protein